MQLTLVLLSLLASVSPVQAAYNCYTTVGNSTTPSTALYSGIGGQCNSYQYSCNQNYNATCTTVEIAASTVKWAFTFTSTAGCAAMYKDPSFSNVCCCGTDLCNSPANVYGCTSAGIVNTKPANSTTTSTTSGAELGISGSLSVAFFAAVLMAMAI